MTLDGRNSEYRKLSFWQRVYEDNCVTIIACFVIGVIIQGMARAGTPDALASYHPSSSSSTFAAGFACGWPAAFTSAVTDAALRVSAGAKSTARGMIRTWGEQGDSPPSQNAALLAFLTYEVHRVNPDADAGWVASLLCDTADPLRNAALARYESGYRVSCRGSAGERGLLQIHPCHKRSMKRAGLDFYAEADRLAFADMLFESRGWSPWAVRSRAKREYLRLQLAWVDWDD